MPVSLDIIIVTMQSRQISWLQDFSTTNGVSYCREHLLQSNDVEHFLSMSCSNSSGVINARSSSSVKLPPHLLMQSFGHWTSENSELRTASCRHGSQKRWEHLSKTTPDSGGQVRTQAGHRKFAIHRLREGSVALKFKKYAYITRSKSRNMDYRSYGVRVTRVWYVFLSLKFRI